MEEKETDIKMLTIVELHDFEGHPFKVEHDMALFELMRSIENEGVIVPALASPKADELLAKQVGENRMTIHRYIRLTNLIPKVLDMVDEGKIAFTVAVELSYLTEEQQYEL